MTDEEYVRSRWEPLYGPSCSYGGTLSVLDGRREGFTMQIGWAMNFPEFWAQAAEFTRQREEEIRKVEEEIADIEDELNGFIGSKRVSFVRILVARKAALAELKKGWKA